MSLEEILEEISSHAKPKWAAHGEVELFRRSRGAWVCHTAGYHATSENPTEAALLVLKQIKKGDPPR
jgi:hypothetical protein